ncbi:protealysin inhibitor emfourin, partial [Frankia sp. CcWB3]
MARTAERVWVVLERSGGLLGRSVRRGLDTADLSKQEAENLRRLAREAVHHGDLAATTDAADAGQVDSTEARGSTAP